MVSPLHELLCQSNVCCPEVSGKGCTQSFGVRLRKVPCVVLLPITIVASESKLLIPRFERRQREKSHIFGEWYDVQFLVLRTLSKMSHLYCQKEMFWEHWHTGGCCDTVSARAEQPVHALQSSYSNMDCLLH